MTPDDTFGSTLRALRDRVVPGEVGIPGALPGRRRVPGLRRDELAGLAGVSEDYLKRLEQGRRSPSVGVVDALAKALGLDGNEHRALRGAAGFAAPRGRSAQGSAGCKRVPREITPSARRLLDRAHMPTCVCDASWSVLAGNRHWTAFECVAAGASGRDRNMAWRAFTDAPTTVSRTPEQLDAFQAAIVADLHAGAHRYPDDPELRDLVTDLRAVSEVFAGLWDREKTVPAAFRGRHDPADSFIVRHPTLGDFRLDKDVLVVEPGDLRVVVFTAQ